MKLYLDFIYMNRYRAGGLRGNEKAAIVAVVIKGARQIYPKQADQLTLVFS